jgi:hypothetical protein
VDGPIIRIRRLDLYPFNTLLYPHMAGFHILVVGKKSDRRTQDPILRT